MSVGGGLKKSNIFSHEQLSVLRSNYIVNKYPRREELMKIAEDIGHSYKSVLSWFGNSKRTKGQETSERGYEE